MTKKKKKQPSTRGKASCKAHAGPPGKTDEETVEEQRALLAHFEAQMQASREPAPDVAAAAACETDAREEEAEVEVEDSGPTPDEVFTIRRIDFHARRVPVLLQNGDGPCSLLAVANALLLRGTMSFPEDERSITGSALVARLSDLCRSLNGKAEDLNMQETVSYITKRMPKLMYGLFLNCCFTGCSDFEYTADLALFDCFGLSLYHLLVDPDVADVAPHWNALGDRLAACAELQGDLERSGRTPSTEEDTMLAQGLCLQEFVDEHITQTTRRGLRAFADVLGDRELCVLFRNNHFNTVYRPRPGLVCVLLSNVAFDGLDDAVWESLEEDGDSGEILNAEFSAGGSGEGGRGGYSKREELIGSVLQVGFARSLAEAGLAAVDWRGADEAVQAILDADCDEAALKERAASHLRRTSTSAHGGVGGGGCGVFECPTCHKKMSSANGLLCHRRAKGH